jgi:hypothetical protein
MAVRLVLSTPTDSTAPTIPSTMNALVYSEVSQHLGHARSAADLMVLIQAIQKLEIKECQTPEVGNQDVLLKGDVLLHCRLLLLLIRWILHSRNLGFVALSSPTNHPSGETGANTRPSNRYLRNRCSGSRRRNRYQVIGRTTSTRSGVGN